MGDGPVNDDRYTVISADCHGGGAIGDYRPYLPSRLHDTFDAWRATFDNPYDDLEGDDGRPQLGQRAPPGRARGRRRGGRGHLPQHHPAVLPPGLARAPAARGQRRRPRAAVGGAAGAQPLAGRLLRGDARPSRRHRPDPAARPRRRGGRGAVGGRRRADRRRAAARSAAGIGSRPALRARLRAALGRRARSSGCRSTTTPAAHRPTTATIPRPRSCSSSRPPGGRTARSGS